MKNKLEGKVWYRFYKVFSISIIALSFFSPLFIRLNLSNSFWYIDGIINVFIWSFIFLVLKKIIVYVLYGKNLTISVEQTNQTEIKENKKFNLEESWGFPIGLLLVFGIAGSLIGSMSGVDATSIIIGLLGGIGVGVAMLIFIYVLYEVTK